jgi:hypothetical protein
MSKHTNKHWLREKEFISLEMEYDYLCNSLPRARRWGRSLPNTRLEEIDRKLLYKFYNEHHGHWNTAPKHYRKMLNKIQRAKAKQILHKILDGKEPCFEDNYRGCNWYW